MEPNNRRGYVVTDSIDRNKVAVLGRYHMPVLSISNPNEHEPTNTYRACHPPHLPRGHVEHYGRKPGPYNVFATKFSALVLGALPLAEAWLASPVMFCSPGVIREQASAIGHQSYETERCSSDQRPVYGSRVIVSGCSSLAPVVPGTQS